MGAVDDIFEILSSYHGGYRLMRKHMAGDTRNFSRKPAIRGSEDTIRVTLSRLKARGLVRNDGGLWKLTEKGRGFFAKRLPRLRFLQRAPRSRKNMIVAFDIPQSHRRTRDWLRFRLQDLGFTMMQKSVWFGAAPLPQEFIQALGRLDILRFMKFFKAEEQDVV